MLNIALAEATVINDFTDLIPGIHTFYQQFGYLGKTLLQGLNVTFNHVVMTLLTMTVLVIMVFKSTNKFKPQPDSGLTPRTFFEVILEILIDFMQEQFGSREKAKKFLPLIFGIAMFILFNNLVAFIPGLSPATANLNTHVGLAITVFFVSNIAGVRAVGLGPYLTRLLGPIRKWYALPLMLFLLFINLMGELVRPVTHTLRLMANMFADHVVAVVLISLFAVATPLLPMAIGVMIVLVQTMVFTILATVYISNAMAETE
ncbi:MAG: F0F1 ATP synthase subunit A [Proteobacteria bacterium]|nr:F0F1 ATP synthase subunit A [Pseudomonadota bacterium]